MGQVLLLTLVLFFSPAVQQSTDITMRFNRAVEFQREGQLKPAADEYRAVLKIAPDYAEAHANLGVVLAQLGRYEESVSAYESALRLAPHLTPIHLNLGIAHYRADQFERAADSFRSFLTSTPDHIQARQLLGLSLFELGRDTEAIPILEQTVNKSPDDAAILYALGLAYMRQRYAGVDEIIERLAKAPNGHPAARLLRGQFYLGRFEYERALTELEAAAKLNPELPRLQYSLGLAYYSTHRNKEAVAAFEAELRRRPRDFSTLYYLAFIHEAQDNLDDARRRLDAALRLEPQSPEGNVLLGKILVKQERFAEAVGPFERAVAADSQDPLKRWHLARVYRQLNRQQDADREFAEMKRLNALKLKDDRARTPKQ
ncbi:MAG TPA: tetratricopeptide repeat protein [Pyrinomonadaceae bacterium]|nr:tetratricopeptide repeat protein [Pyrinomonadaceae bacterium]